MKRKSAEGLPAGQGVTPAANDEFTGMVHDHLDQVSYTYSQSGWDPYEVWRTRVKASSKVKPEHEGEPLR